MLVHIPVVRIKDQLGRCFVLVGKMYPVVLAFDAFRNFIMIIGQLNYRSERLRKCWYDQLSGCLARHLRVQTS